MIYLTALLVFILLFSLMLVFYKYLFDVLKYFKLNKNKKTKYYVLAFSIIMFFGSIFLIFVSKIASVISIFILYLICFSIIFYILNIFLKKYKTWNKVFLMLPFLFTLIYVSYGLYNMKDVKHHEYTLHNEKLNNNYKGILIADLHYGVSLNDNELKKYCDEISNLNPDFVFLAGDIVDERTTYEQMESAFKILGNIKTKYGIYYTYGNHDKNNYSRNKKYTVGELNKIIEQNRIVILEEEKKYINDDIVLIGRGYEVRKDINEILEEDDKNLYSILIDHIPQQYKINKEAGINLELSGHTHAGQIFPVGIIEKMYKTSDLIYGKLEDENFTGIVTSGIAGWAIPIRTEAKSEYVVLNLTK